MNSHSSLSSQMQAYNNSSAAVGSGMSDDMSEDEDDDSSPDTFDEGDLMTSDMADDVQAQLAAAGPIGVAAAACIATGKRRKRPHTFETNPSIRKRQQTRLIRKLRATIEEYTTRVGQQAIILAVTPGKSATSGQSFKVFGSQPLENVVRNCRSTIMNELEQVLAQQAPNSRNDTSNMYELPPLIVDGIPTPVDKMTQAQLRMFIPEMLKYSTGRSKPGWGKMECRPTWWPGDLPWANVRCDVRSEDDKKRVSWTHALRTIVRNCYKHHGREDLLPAFDDTQPQPSTSQQFEQQQTLMQTISNPDGSLSIIQIDTGAGVAHQLGPGHQLVTLADGTQAAVIQALPHHTLHEASQAAKTLAEATNQPVTVEISDHATIAAVSEATMGADGQLLLPDSGGRQLIVPMAVYNRMLGTISSLEGGATLHLVPKQEHDIPVAGQAVEVMTITQR